MYPEKLPKKKGRWSKAARKKHFEKRRKDREEEIMAFVARTVTCKEYQT